MIKRTVCLIMSLFVCMAVFSGCADNGREDETYTGSGDNISAVDEYTEEYDDNKDEMFTDRDSECDYIPENCIRINLDSSSATASSDSVEIRDGIVKITEEAEYIISGRLSEGIIVIDCDDTAKIRLILDDAHITSSSFAALYVKNADKVFVTLADGTENFLANGGGFEKIDENNVDAAVFSEQDITFNGSGTLTVTSPAAHGIVCKDDIVFTGGNYNIYSAYHAVDANDSVRIASGTFITIDCGKDGIHCENSSTDSCGFVYIGGGELNIQAEGDGISAGEDVTISGGNFDITCGGGSVNASKASSDNYGNFMGKGRPGPGGHDDLYYEETSDEDSMSMKGIKAEAEICITGGSFLIDSADDSVHSNGSISVGGGNFVISSGDDAFHGDEDLAVNAGDILVRVCYEGLEAENISISGGNIEVHSDDDGFNASGGTDLSATTGGRDAMFPGSGKRGPGGNASSGKIEISGGNIRIYASGDGIDSNGTLGISGGYIYIANPSSGDTSVIDSDSSPTISGGIFVSTGASTMMAQSFSSSSSQGVIACTIGSQDGGENITVTAADKSKVLSYESEYPFVLVIISSPEIVKGEEYTLSVGDLSGSIQAQ